MDVFKGVHERHRSASDIATAFYNILYHLRHQSMSPHTFLPQFGSHVDDFLLEVWTKQKRIRWGQVMKGRLSKKWGEAQNIYYQMNPDKNWETYLNKKVWT